MNDYYIPRWVIFIEYLKAVPLQRYNETELKSRLRDFERRWVSGSDNETAIHRAQVSVELRDVLEEVAGTWSEVFGK